MTDGMKTVLMVALMSVSALGTGCDLQEKMSAKVLGKDKSDGELVIHRAPMRTIQIGRGSVCTRCEGVESDPDVILKVYLDDEPLLRGGRRKDTASPSWDLISRPFDPSTVEAIQFEALESDSYRSDDSDEDTSRLGTGQLTMAEFPEQGPFKVELGLCSSTHQWELSAAYIPCMTLQGRVETTEEIVSISGGPEVSLESIPRDLLGLRCNGCWLFNSPEEFRGVRILKVIPGEDGVRVVVDLFLVDRRRGSGRNIMATILYTETEGIWAARSVDCDC
ncbi:MAG: hypothetical protein ABIK09_08440 [Pseudomonadota bacterium]